MLKLEDLTVMAWDLCRLPPFSSLSSLLPSLSVVSDNAQVSKKLLLPLERRLTDPLTPDSSVALKVESVSLLHSLASLLWIPIALGSRSRRYGAGEPSAVTAPLVVLTETTYIIETHMLDDSTHTHTHNLLTLPSNSKTTKQMLNCSPPSSFFRQPASISRSPASPVVLSFLTPHEVSSSSFSLAFLSIFLCTSVPSASGIPHGAKKRPALTLEQKNCLQQSWSECSDYSYAGIIGEPAVAQRGLLGELGKRQRMRGDGAERKTELTPCRSLYTVITSTEWLVMYGLFNQGIIPTLSSKLRP